MTPLAFDIRHIDAAIRIDVLGNKGVAVAIESDHQSDIERFVGAFPNLRSPLNEGGTFIFMRKNVEPIDWNTSCFRFGVIPPGEAFDWFSPEAPLPFCFVE